MSEYAVFGEQAKNKSADPLPRSEAVSEPAADFRHWLRQQEQAMSGEEFERLAWEYYFRSMALHVILPYLGHQESYWKSVNKTLDKTLRNLWAR